MLYLDSDDVLHQNETLKPFIELNNLRPYHNYTFTVAVNSGSEASLLRMSTPLSRTFETQESVPGMVINSFSNTILYKIKTQHYKFLLNDL